MTNDQQTPFIGAQVFIQPGQTRADIERWFRLLRDSNMTACRIRMHEEHLHRPDGSWDFSLYDYAFEMAEKYDISVFATLFPYEKAVWPMTKYPLSKENLDEIRYYIQTVVSHYSDSTALYCWVLQNEPGSYGAYPHSDLSDALKAEWIDAQPAASYLSHGYVQQQAFEEQRFQRYYTSWFLAWIASEVRKLDPKHELHTNPYEIFANAAEYDFVAWRNFLTIFGASCHPAHHFGDFPRRQFSLALSMNCEMLRAGAGKLPFMVTELQGGNNTYSADVPMCPTKEEIAQWLWTAVGAGAKGVIFWTLNPRAVGGEAGEWAMVNFQNKASDRLLAASSVAVALQENHKLLSAATPLESSIYLLYAKEAFWTEAKTAAGTDEKAEYEGRKTRSGIKSVIGWYGAVTDLGLSANVCEMAEFDWDSSDHSGRTIILSHQIAIGSTYWPKLRHFVTTGGKLIADGLTFFFDENDFSVMQTGFPLEDVFGASLEEVRTIAGDFSINIHDDPLALPAHLFKGTLSVSTASAIAADADGVLATRNSYGNGVAVWIPSMLGFGALRLGKSSLCAFLTAELGDSLTTAPIRFAQVQTDVTMRVMRSGSSLITIMVNKSSGPKKINLQFDRCALSPNVLYSNNASTIAGADFVILPEETIVIEWR
ncbi:MAG TPA: beta-galactosidase [Capsulimonadaceae bacterium]